MTNQIKFKSNGSIELVSANRSLYIDIQKGTMNIYISIFSCFQDYIVIYWERPNLVQACK